MSCAQLRHSHFVEYKNNWVKYEDLGAGVKSKPPNASFLFSITWIPLHCGASHSETIDVDTISGGGARLGSDGASPAPAAGLPSSPVYPARRWLVCTRSNAMLQHSHTQWAHEFLVSLGRSNIFSVDSKHPQCVLMWFVDCFFHSSSSPKITIKNLSTKLSCVCMCMSTCKAESCGDIRQILNGFL